MEFDCEICGSPVQLGHWANGCKIFCDDCYNNEEVMDWYRNHTPVKGARQLHWEANHAKPA